MLDNCPALRLFALTYSGWGMFGDVGMGYPDGYDKEVYIRIYIYIKKNLLNLVIYIYILYILGKPLRNQWT
jgi:Na+/proline symporter